MSENEKDLHRDVSTVFADPVHRRLRADSSLDMIRNRQLICWKFVLASWKVVVERCSIFCITIAMNEQAADASNTMVHGSVSRESFLNMASCLTGARKEARSR